MATWQFKIELIPRQWAEGSEGEIEALYDSEGYDSTSTWVQYPPTIDVESLIERIMPKGKSWHSDLHAWGDEERNDIQIWYKGGKLECLVVRLDLRENMDNLLAKIADLAKTLDCLIFVPEFKTIINPTVSELGKAAAQSNAARFVKDPEGFLNKLGSA